MYREIIRRRTIRKYKPRAVPQEILVKCVDAARLSPFGANRQSLKYVIINDGELEKSI